MPLTGVRLEGKQMEEYDQAFTIFDSDGDGKVNKDQAASIIRAIGLSPTNEQMSDVLGDRDRMFDRRELQQIISTKAPPPESEEALREAFRVFDKEGAGFVDAKELRHALVHLGEKLLDDQVDEMIREVEINGDNQINCEDFVQTMKSI